MKKSIWHGFTNSDTTQTLYYKVSRGVLAAINDIRLGIAKSDFLDWALAIGLTRSTASRYWSTAHRLVNAATDNVRFYAD